MYVPAAAERGKVHGRILLRRTYPALVLCVVGAVGLLSPSGSAGSTAMGACVQKRCLYDVEFRAQTTLPEIGTFGLTARFRRVTLSHSPPSPTGLTISFRERNSRATGTVVGALDIESAGCVHKRTYPATGQADLSIDIPLGRRRAPTVSFALATPRLIPPEWADTCPSYRAQDRDLASAMFAVGNQVVPLRGTGGTGHLSGGQDPFIVSGAPSLAAEYQYNGQRPQASVGSLTSPWRELWAGKSALIRQRAVFGTQAGNAVTNLTLRFTRR